MRDVEERRGQNARAVVDDDLAALQRDEQPRVAGVGDADRLIEAAGNLLEADVLRVDVGRDERKDEDGESLHGCWVCMQQVGLMVRSLKCKAVEEIETCDRTKMKFEARSIRPAVP